MEIAPRRVHITETPYLILPTYSNRNPAASPAGGRGNKVKQCCGCCKFNEYGDDDFFCSNMESEAWGCETTYNECCEAFEAEEDEDD